MVLQLPLPSKKSGTILTRIQRRYVYHRRSSLYIILLRSVHFEEIQVPFRSSQEDLLETSARPPSVRPSSYFELSVLYFLAFLLDLVDSRLSISLF